MKKDFFDYLISIMAQQQDIYFISAGLGYPRTNELKKLYPDRYIQTEASEQTALDVCVGLAYEKKIPIVYTITPFLFRAFETIRTYINHERLHVIMVGAGRNDDYSKHDGYSHDATDIELILSTQKNIDLYFPKDREELEKAIDLALVVVKPHFISVTR